jgi:hypothetical protein
MLSEASGSSTAAGRRDGQRQAPSKSPAPVVLLPTSEKEPPPYGAQHRQDALWKGKEPSSDTHRLTQSEAGGNEALPPLWQQFRVLDHLIYQDDTLAMTTINRPLPGVRLGEQRKCYQKRQFHDITQIILEFSLIPNANGTSHHLVGPTSSTTILGLRHGINQSQNVQQGA